MASNNDHDALAPPALRAARLPVIQDKLAVRFNSKKLHQYDWIFNNEEFKAAVMTVLGSNYLQVLEVFTNGSGIECRFLLLLANSMQVHQRGVKKRPYHDESEDDESAIGRTVLNGICCARLATEQTWQCMNMSEEKTKQVEEIVAHLKTHLVFPVSKYAKAAPYPIDTLRPCLYHLKVKRDRPFRLLSTWARSRSFSFVQTPSQAGILVRGKKHFRLLDCSLGITCDTCKCGAANAFKFGALYS
ncbi:hypothetical protein PG997_008777 [Apiospora hydei]|uniref:Uncharacterized protein n=1 Tax=Apiospora hydei TaxID=1337664 RepID=A0ABR1WFL8_9PEZI